MTSLVNILPFQSKAKTFFPIIFIILWILFEKLSSLTHTVQKKNYLIFNVLKSCSKHYREKTTTTKTNEARNEIHKKKEKTKMPNA